MGTKTNIIDMDFLNENTTQKNITWLSISNGQIVTKVDSTDPKAVKRINKAGNEVYERFFSSTSGKITSLALETNKFGEQQFKVGIQNGENFGILSFNADSSYGRSFYQQIFNVDFGKMIAFNPWQKVTDDGRKITRLYLSYGRDKVEMKYPDGTPEIKFVQTKKGSVVDMVSKAAFEEFLEEKLTELIKANNLTPAETTVDLGEDVDTTPLTKEEVAQLSKAKKKKGEPVNEDFDLDDLFN